MNYSMGSDYDLDLPTIPIFKLFPGLPRRVFFSAAAAFLGGILFFTERGRVVENLRSSGDP